MGVTRTIEQIARGIEILGITTLVSGLAIAVVRAVNILIHSRSAESAYPVTSATFSFQRPSHGGLLSLAALTLANGIRSIS
jgi:hypothetical protein